MASNALSPLASSVEKTNGTKLSRLLIDGGTTALRIVFDRFHPPMNLSAGLSANYSVLNNLMKKKVLRSAQWDKLFPPGGARPDSKKFDITLLFLLLTNICGLSPPIAGWHSKPCVSDNSLEANLARVKFFRNELYGHVSTTAIDTPTFSSLWLEISAVLVVLGLGQAEVDRLKAEHCGEEDYINVLLEWAESEDDIKSQLADILRSQTKARQDIGDVRQTQLQNQKILEDNKSKLKEIHRFQLETAQSVDDVLQIQLEDSKTLAEVHQTQINTQHALANLHQIHKDEFKTAQETKSNVEKVLRSQEKHHETLKQLRHRTTKDKESEILEKLAKIDAEKDVNYYAKRYQEGTRVSILKKVENWLDDRSSQNRVMVVSGNAGMGKSVLSAVICKKMQETGRLSGSHFCQHGKARHRNPKVLLQSLACQLSDSLQNYKSALVEKLSRNLGEDLNSMEISDLFDLLFEETLWSVADPGRNILMVIDGLDESEYQGRNELLDVVANHFCKLPCWIRFFVTTRPEINIAASLRALKPLQLEHNDEENLQDIRLYFTNHLSQVIGGEHQEIVLEKLVSKSEGVILFAYFLVDVIKEKRRRQEEMPLTPDLLESSLPSGISFVCHSYFKRLESELHKEHGITENQFFSFLCALTAAVEPLPIGFVSKLLMSGRRSSVGQRAVNKAIACISALLPVQDGCIHFFHKSVKDWLTMYEQHDFTVNEKEGHRILTELCLVELDAIKRNGVTRTQLSDTTKYALQHGVQHMLELQEEDTRECLLEEVVNKYVVDLELVYAKLCVNSTAASEDIVYVEKQEGFGRLCQKSHCALRTLSFLLRKDIGGLAKLPHLVLQSVLNEGGSELSAEVSNLLKVKYPEVSYMEYVQKDTQKAAVQARFECSSEVACFDVSRQLDNYFMVCECVDATIQLWSLKTGKLLWKRPALTVKSFEFISGAYRPLSDTAVLSCYRSVVFHPTDNVVLPGVLSHAYTIDGDLKPLFPKSTCKFTVCSISEDKTTMLTDCPNDAKCIVMWSLANGIEITRTTRNEDVLSFAWSRDGRVLAISLANGSICLVDVQNSFEILTETKTPKECGMIKFSPDCRMLFCFRSPLYGSDGNLFCLDVSNKTQCTFSSYVCSKEFFHDPSHSGFLLGDPFSCSLDRKRYVPLEFLVDEDILLRVDPFSSLVQMFSATCATQPRQVCRTPVKQLAFSLNGETVYVVSDSALPKVMAWDVSSGNLKAEKSIGNTGRICLVPVTEGVILATHGNTPKLWNCQLSECIRLWPYLHEIAEIIPLSEDRVACIRERVEVNVIDTASGDVLSTIPTDGRNCIACNSKCQLITSDARTIQFLDGISVLWEWDLDTNLRLYVRFSPNDQFVAFHKKSLEEAGTGLLFINAHSGKEECSIVGQVDCYEFISDEDIVVSSFEMVVHCLKVFNVTSGDLLSVLYMETAPFCLAACPSRRLVAVGLDNPDANFKLLRVKLPQRDDPYIYDWESSRLAVKAWFCKIGQCANNGQAIGLRD